LVGARGFEPRTPCAQVEPVSGREPAGEILSGAKEPFRGEVEIKLVGARGFEPRTPCAQGSDRNTISLARLAFLYVVVHGFGPSLAASGPKLDPSFNSSWRSTSGVTGRPNRFHGLGFLYLTRENIYQRQPKGWRCRFISGQADYPDLSRVQS
jgi:hypothetical protein